MWCLCNGRKTLGREWNFAHSADLVPGRGGKKDRLAFPEKVALSEIGLPVAEAKAKINISGSGAIGVAAIKDPRWIECVPASGNILEAQQMSWQRVQLIDKLLFSVARPPAPTHSLRAKKKSGDSERDAARAINLSHF